MALIHPWMLFLKIENYLQELTRSSHSIQYDCSVVSPKCMEHVPDGVPTEILSNMTKFMTSPLRSHQIWLNSWLVYDCSHTFVHRELHMTSYDYVVIYILTTLGIFPWFSCSDWIGTTPPHSPLPRYFLGHAVN